METAWLDEYGIYIIILMPIFVALLLSVDPITSGFAYFIGRLLLRLFFDDIESKSFQKSRRRMSAWGEHIYEEDGKQYFYTETIHLVGTIILTIVTLIIGIIYLA